MKTKMNINTDNVVELKNLEKGDWFMYCMPDGSNVVAIKSDDTVYDGEKIICMRVHPNCGVLSRLQKNEIVKLIDGIEVLIQ